MVLVTLTQTRHENPYIVSEIVSVKLTWGPTTPVGPGGPVFPWNPCSHTKDGYQKSLCCMCVLVCVYV